MADIFRNGQFEPDSWRLLGADETPAAGETVLVPLARVAADPATWAASPARLGLVVQPADKLEDIAAHLGLFEVAAVVFPKFNDGRGFTHARLLSEKYGFKGEIRALGEVLLDQIPLMSRVGITAFVIENAPTRRELLAGNVPAVPYFYQPAADNPETVAGRRWLGRG